MIILSSLITSLQKELGSFNANEEFPDMYRYINSAINYIYNYRDWDWNKHVYAFNYLSASTEQTLPFYPQKVFSIKLNGELLPIYNNEQWFVAEDTGNAVGCFADKFISGTAGVYYMLYAKSAPTVGVQDISISMPDYYMDILRNVAVHFAYKDIKDYQTAGQLIGLANAMLEPAGNRTVNPLPRNITRIGSNYSF